MTDIERIELAIRRVLAGPMAKWETGIVLLALADELAKMKHDGSAVRALGDELRGYKLNWVP